MITEIAHLTIDPARAAEFERTVASCAPLFQSTAGCHGMSLEREIENPAIYRLVVLWESVEAHTVGFRNSEAFKSWRAAAGPFFVVPPAVVHTALVARHF